ncbi:MAG: FecR family protein [Gemmatimonadaceae bacterium]
MTPDPNEQNMTDTEWAELARYVAGECPSEEREAMRRWIAEDEQRSGLTFDLELIARGTLLDRSEWDTHGGWERLIMRAKRPHADRRSQTFRAFTAPVVRARSRWRGAGWALAAAVLLVMVGGGYWYRLRSAAQIASAPTLPPPHVFTTQRAQVAQTTLDDGTEVSLAPESQLIVPADYGVKTRTVYLEGQGYFRVVHDSLHPFVVHAGGSVMRDLGTAFVVVDYPTDRAVRVVVASGRVRVRNADAPAASGAVLTSGDMARLVPRGAPVVEHGVDVSRYLGWTQGQLVFYRTPLADALRELDRWYDVRFVLADSTLGSRPVTMAIARTTARALTGAMDVVLGLKAEQHGDTIVLRAGLSTVNREERP